MTDLERQAAIAPGMAKYAVVCALGAVLMLGAVVLGGGW